MGEKENTKLELFEESQELDQEQPQMSEEELMALLGGGEKPEFEFAYPPVELEEEEYEELKNTAEYLKGKAMGAELLSMWNILVGGGVDLGTASGLLMNYQTLKFNNELQELVNEGLKHQSNLVKQQQL